MLDIPKEGVSEKKGNYKKLDIESSEAADADDVQVMMLHDPEGSSSDRNRMRRINFWRELQPLLHSKHGHKAATGGLFILFIVSFPLLMSTNRQLHELQRDYDEISGLIYTSESGSGETLLNVNANAITFSKPMTYTVVQVIGQDGNRHWDAPALKIVSGDAVHWEWETNENVLSCDSGGSITPKSHRTINSGQLRTSGKYERRFNTAGTYYYLSENSQTMKGVVIVVERQVLTADRSFVGETKLVPSGVQTTITTSDLQKMDGCWAPCHTSDFSSTRPESLLDKCSGDWIFLAAGSAGSILVGAFAKASVFSRSSRDNVFSDYRYQYVTVNNFENGVYWYEAKNTYSGYHTHGFSTNLQTTLYSSYEMVDYPGSSNWNGCQGSLSFGNNGGTANCNWLSSRNNYRIVYTNTCAVAAPPY